MTDPQIDVKFLFLVGPIGAGKTTMLNRMTKCKTDVIEKLFRAENTSIRTGRSEKTFHTGWCHNPHEFDVSSTELLVVPEDPTRWVDENGVQLLDLMRVDAKKYAAKLQTAILHDRVKSATDAVVEALKTAPKGTKTLLVVAEGVISVDRLVYAQACRDNQLITDDEWIDYTNLYKMYRGLDWETAWFEKIQKQCDNVGEVCTLGTLHLATPVDNAIARVVSRGRECEQTLPKDYFYDIADRHFSVLRSMSYKRYQPVVRVRDTPLFETLPFEFD